MRGESGQATVEFSAMIVWLIVAGLIAWEIGLAAWAEVSAVNAARTAARLYSRTGDTTSAIADTKQSLSGFVSHDADVHFNGPTAVVHLNIPIVLPWLSSGVQANADAHMPQTG